jgi:hypothetical protein
VAISGGDGVRDDGGRHAGADLTTLHSFCSENECADGTLPAGPLIQGTDGNLYGTTKGTVFQLTPSGTLTTIYAFCTVGTTRVEGCNIGYCRQLSPFEYM